MKKYLSILFFFICTNLFSQAEFLDYGTKIKRIYGEIDSISSTEITADSILHVKYISFDIAGSYNPDEVPEGVLWWNPTVHTINVSSEIAESSTQVGQEITFSTTGGNNRNGGSMVFYGEFNPGDKIWLELSRTGGTGDFTTVTGNWNIQCLYRE